MSKAAVSCLGSRTSEGNGLIPIVSNHATREKPIPRTTKTPNDSDASKRSYRTNANSVAAYTITYPTRSEIPADLPRLSTGLVRTVEDMVPGDTGTAASLFPVRVGRARTLQCSYADIRERRSEGVRGIGITGPTHFTAWYEGRPRR